MLRKVAKIVKINSLRYYVTAPKVVTSVNVHGSPLITSKRTEYNLLTTERRNGNVKFGAIPLVSDGWRHRKAKGDHFTIHAHVEQKENIDDMPNIYTLTRFNMSDTLLKNLRTELEIRHLTSIQNSAIPVIMDMNHTLIAAETGCGKTLAYLLPVITQVLQKKKDLQQRPMNTPLALILTPGRELATQVADVATKLTANLGLTVKTVLGGHTKQLMLNPDFCDVDILVGTLGAISKLSTTGIYRMTQVRHVVLDEADTLLDDSFSHKLCYFLRRFPFHRNHLHDLSENVIGTQLILASATMPTNITELLSQVVDTETIHEVVSPNLHRLMPHITQKFLRMNKSDRPPQLLSLVKSELRKKRPIIVFSNKSATCDFVSLFLNDRNVKCVNLNGDMLMEVRIGKFEQFQNGVIDVLSTTDIGSRGLDTTRARHIINFDFPLHIADYIHRCGRIGRVGSPEKCLITNFVSSQREIHVVQRIEHAARTTGLLPNVNANITNLISKKIMKEIESEDIEAL